MNILIVDDEMSVLTSVKRVLNRKGFKKIEFSTDGEKAIIMMKNKYYDLVLLDVLMPRCDGLSVLQATKSCNPGVEFIMLTALDDVATAVKSIHMGASDYLVKPVDNDRLLQSVRQVLKRKDMFNGIDFSGVGRMENNIPKAFEEIKTQSYQMIHLLNYAQAMSTSNAPILITGDSGTGKELMARAIHKAGPKPKGPFIATNITSTPDTLFDSHLFGYCKGAYTGATTDCPGIFEQADKGTIFLDEIGELPFPNQAKLLRVLEDKIVTRLGDTRPRKIDVRIVSSTNSDLKKACRKGRFRLDLFYRLRGVHIHLPSLKDRQGDIPFLAVTFLKQVCERYNKNIEGFTSEAMDILNDYDYPGNIRELFNLIENAVIFCNENFIFPRHIDKNIISDTNIPNELHTLKEASKRYIAYVLKKTDGNKKKAAEILGVSLRHIQRRSSEIMKDTENK